MIRQVSFFLGYVWVPTVQYNIVNKQVEGKLGILLLDQGSKKNL